MTKVRCILVETTFPVRIRPRMETIPVNGHFLSARILRQHFVHPRGFAGLVAVDRFLVGIAKIFTYRCRNRRSQFLVS